MTSIYLLTFAERLVESIQEKGLEDAFPEMAAPTAGELLLPRLQDQSLDNGRFVQAHRSEKTPPMG